MKFTVSDEPSKSANPGRGYHASICTVTFEANSTGYTLIEEAQREWVNKIAENFQNDMWCVIKQHQPNVWTIHHGFDSGD